MSPIGSKPLLPPKELLNCDCRSYLYTGAHSPALRSVFAAMTWAYETKSTGPAGRKELFATEGKARESIGRLLDQPASNVALVGDASTAWSAIANGWVWKPGDNVVANEYEHPSVYAPWLRFKDQGLEVRIARKKPDWTLPVEAIEEQCDENTTAILLSHVGYVTGYRHDLKAVGDMAARRGIPLLLDISHSLGVIPIDLEYCSIAVSASYKWTLGPYGVGIVAWNRDRLQDFRPGVVGWRSAPDIFLDDRFETIHLSEDARRFQAGAPALSDIAGLKAAADTVLAIGLPQAAEHARVLSGLAHDRLSELGLTVVTPRNDDQRAGNLAFLHQDGEGFADRLARDGIFVWGGDGRVRASFHVMNSVSDVDILVDAVTDVLEEMPAAVRA